MIGQQWQIPIFSKEEGERRHRKIRELMASRGIDCLIISSHLGMYRSQAADLRYVCNYSTWGDGEHVVFPLNGEPVRFTWSKSKEFWAKKVSWIPVKISAKTKEGFSDLIAVLVKMSEKVLDYTDPKEEAKGIVIEKYNDVQGVGSAIDIILTHGQLKVYERRAKTLSTIYA